MAYDEYLGERISRSLSEKNCTFSTKKMMGGLIFMLNDKMACGIHIDKKSQESLLMLRVGEKAYQQEIEKSVCRPMDYTGRPMKGYLFIIAEGFDLDEDLDYWLDLVIAFNRELSV